MEAGWPESLIRDVPDFPAPGVVFKDITPLLDDAEAFRWAVDGLADRFSAAPADRVVGVEARGFILGAAVAYRLGLGFVPVRKPGKLPHLTRSVDYQLEYGAASLEVHIDALAPGQRVLIVDDVLATGGTAAAAVDLVASTGAAVAGVGFLIELGFLNGREKIGIGADSSVVSLLHYRGADARC
ncbi:MAG: adenine phosphoribosyltransferase [bacterium]|nr:adenine phosphoribosyltransferase [bacterium]MCY4193000.1 adenine phosphoribosyltransferase [bacterium]MCY4271656.1 adenine phosphoribosyltransferase [bacterium]